jgi:serine/threonine protein kinase
MPVNRSSLESSLDVARRELDRRVRAGESAPAQELLDSHPDLRSDPEAALELIYGEFALLKSLGRDPDPDEYRRRHPEFADRLDRLFGLSDLLAGDTRPQAAVDGDDTVDEELALEPPPGYEVYEELGRGGMARVFRAKQLRLQRVVALKVLRGAGWFGADDAARIRHEAEAAARLQHPNIIQIHEIGDWDEAPFLALEFAPEGTLEQHLTRHQRAGTVGLTPERAGRLVETLAEAIAHAHAQGVIHRDLKPANILLAGPPEDPISVPKIADFGLALTIDNQGLTQSGALAGTPCFMAPEQAAGKRSEIGPRTDVYALGAILYQLLIGRPPLQGSTVIETLDLVRQVEPAAIRLLRPGVPRDLETICHKCLAKSAAGRYASAAELAADLGRWRRGEPIRARPVSAIERTLKWSARHPLLVGMASVAAGSLIALSVTLAVSYRQVSAALSAEHDANAKLTDSLGRERRTAADMRVLTARRDWEALDFAAARKRLADVPDEFRDRAWRTLHRSLTAQISASERFPGLVQRLGWSPDGTRLAVSTVSNRSEPELVVIDPESGRTLARLEGGKEFSSLSLGTLMFREGSTSIATFWEPRALNMAIPRVVAGQIRVLQVSGNRLISRTNVPTPASQMQVSKLFALQGTALVTYRNRRELTLWRFEENRPPEVVGIQETDIVELAVSDHGKHAATLDAEGRTVLWDLVARTRRPTIVPTDEVSFRGRSFQAGGVSADGRTAAFPPIVDDNGSRLLVSSAEPRVGSRILTGSTRGFQKAAIHPEGTLVAAATGDGYANLWDGTTGVRLLHLRVDGGNAGGATFSPDGTKLATYGGDRVVRVWNVKPPYE